jgi:hypothetical protein
MGVRALFGPSQKEVWQSLAEKIHGNFDPGGFFRPGRLDVHVGEWTVTLDTFTVPAGQAHIPFTRFRAPFVNSDGFRFTIAKKTFLHSIGAFFGMQDVEVGFDDIHREFVVKGTDEGKLSSLFSNAQFRAMLQADPKIRLEVKDDEGWFGKKFPEGVDELCLTIQGIITDIDRLQRLYDLFGLTLHQLCHIGSAYESDPQLTL